MKFKVRFKIGNRYGYASVYSLREFCLYIFNQCSLTEAELCHILTLGLHEQYHCHCSVMSIERIK